MSSATVISPSMGKPPHVITNRSGPLVANVRRRFLEAYEKEPTEFDERDVQRIRTNDWFIKRFLIARNRHESNTLKMLIAAMKWRKFENFHHLSLDMFPAEIFELGAVFKYLPDKDGNPTLYFRVKYLFRIPEAIEMVKKYAKFLLFLADEESNGNGLTIVVDFKDVGFKNVELECLRYAITVLLQYFPAGLANILVVDLPIFFRALWFTTKGWIPENRRKLLKFVTRETIRDFIQTDNLPKFLGGEGQKPYRGKDAIPDGAVFCADIGWEMGGVSADRSREIFKFYEPYFKENDE